MSCEYAIVELIRYKTFGDNRTRSEQKRAPETERSVHRRFPGSVNGTMKRPTLHQSVERFNQEEI